jgi:hypothetical protein
LERTLLAKTSSREDTQDSDSTVQETLQAQLNTTFFWKCLTKTPDVDKARFAPYLFYNKA